MVKLMKLKINQLTNNKLVTIRFGPTQFNNVISLIKECDLIITIDNTIAHLSSSLGKIMDITALLC